MKSKILTLAVLPLLLLVSTARIVAQDRGPVHFSGLINDYSPLNATVKGSPWEMHGQWSLDVYPERGRADFAADMTMSGFGKTSTGAVDPSQPLVNPHTHHIRLTNARATSDTWAMAHAAIPPSCTISGSPMCERSSLNCALKYDGSQNR